MTDRMDTEATIGAAILAYDRENPMRTADMHPAHCDCLRCAIDALRALPAAAPSVKVKPLVWVERSDILGLHNAKGADGYWYNVQQEASNAFTYEGHPSDMPDSIRVECDTLEDAKAAAQVDYEARILAAIEPVTAQPLPLPSNPEPISL